MFQNAPHNYFQCDTCIIKVTCTQPRNIFFNIMKMISGEIINTSKEYFESPINKLTSHDLSIFSFFDSSNDPLAVSVFLVPNDNYF